MSLIKTHLLEQQQLLDGDVMSCLNDDDRELVGFLSEFYLSNLDDDAVELTDEVYDLMEKLGLRV